VGRFAIAGALVLMAIVPAPAAVAATAAVTGASVSYSAAPGEGNDLTATASVDGVEFQDAGASVSAGRGCDQLDAHTARCYARADSFFTNVDAGDGDDIVRVIDGPGGSARFGVAGGPGNDTLYAAARGSSLDGGPGADTLEGGPGGDTLTGGPDADTLVGGGGNDDITPDGAGVPPAPDVVDGGPGSDSVSYAGRTTPVDVDLERPAGNGGPGENDTIRAVENVISGGGSDHLRGDEQANFLSSAGFGTGVTGQHDVIEGRGGDDRIEGSEGADVLSGGAGGDEIEGNGGGDSLSGGPGDDGIDLLEERPASLSCGGGDDLVNYPPLHELIRPDCETVQDTGLFFLVRTRLGRAGRGMRTVEISGLRGLLFEELPCRVVAALSRPGRARGELGMGGVRLPGRGHDRATLRVRLTTAGRRVFASRKGVPVLLRFEGHSSCRAGDRHVDSGVGGFTVLSR
jgi:Ca2+-binding RTX toxin-like protein